MSRKHTIISSTGGGGRTQDPVVAHGPNGVKLQAGNVLVGADVRSLVVQNGLVRVTYEPSQPSDEFGALHLFRFFDREGIYKRALSAQYGDWTFFCSPFQTPADEIRILISDADVFEAAMVWNSHPLNTGWLPVGGVMVRLPHNNLAAYDGDGYMQIYTTVKFVKVFRVERGREGYFVGYHSYPRIGPARVPDWNNENSQAERELGTGSGNAVFFASSGFYSRHPEWGSDARWGGLTNFPGLRHAWARIDDPDYGAAADPQFIEFQNAGFAGSPTFPNEQLVGPWWVADLPYDTETHPFCRYITMIERLEVGCWQFVPHHYGATVVHFMNESYDSSLAVNRFQCFLGAFPYVPDDLAIEPIPELWNAVIARASHRWPR